MTAALISEELQEFFAQARDKVPAVRTVPPDAISPAYVVVQRYDRGDLRWHMVNRSGITRTQVDGKPAQTRYEGWPWLAMYADAVARQEYANAHGHRVRFLAICHQQLGDFGFESG